MHNGSTQWNVVHNEAVLLTEMAANRTQMHAHDLLRIQGRRLDSRISVYTEKLLNGHIS